MTMSMPSSSDTTMMPMSSMMMTFFNSHKTTLFSANWTPSTTGQYAGTCIFLIFFGAVYHALGAFRTNWHHKLSVVENNRRIPIADHSSIKNHGTTESQRDRPWRLTSDLPRALLDTLIAAIGYLLMMAVMTMNVGYFLSVIAGIFASSLLVGRYTLPLQY